MASLVRLSALGTLLKLRPDVLMVTSHSFHTTETTCSRKAKKIRPENPLRAAKEALGPRFKLPKVTPTSGLAKTFHPADPYADVEAHLETSLRAASASDLPQNICNPYARESSKCVLCPRRFAVPLRPDYKNPKLLAQFVSPHTGLVYKSHITGLCRAMQDEVEREVQTAQRLGFLATKMKELIYLKDPPLFNPTRPQRKNPY